MRLVVLLLASIACLPMTTEAQTAGAATGARPGAADPITYTLRFPDAPRHYVDVEASFPAAGQKRIELMMAVWTPGSYLVREYARHVEGLEVVQPSGVAAPIKTRKNRWAIDTGGRRTGRRALPGLRPRDDGPDELDRVALRAAAGPCHLPHARRQDSTARTRSRWTCQPAGHARCPDCPRLSGRPHTFEAADYDTLVDGPIVAGDLDVYEFTRSGKPHYLVNVNEGGSWDGARAIGDVERIVAEHEKLWGSLPYDKYVFVNMITEASGGLEHRNSSVLMTSRWAMGTRQAYVGWLNLVSHEFFHVWNVKRLRPAALGPFDYENENYTPSLWVSEGFTSYYGDLLVRRAGLSSDAEFFGALSSDIRGLETTPGRLVQPVTQSSYDAWIKQYRPDENSANTSVSYYAKGQVIAVLLDARIRLATNGQRSLDDVMRTGPGTVRGGEGLHRGRVPRRDHRGGRR